MELGDARRLANYRKAHPIALEWLDTQELYDLKRSNLALANPQFRVHFRRLRLGKFHCNATGNPTDKTCGACGAQLETRRHIIMECPEWEPIRIELQRTVGAALDKLLGDCYYPLWFARHSQFSDNKWDPYFGATGLIPKTIRSIIKKKYKDEGEKKLNRIINALNTMVMKGAVQIIAARSQLYKERREQQQQ
eukprot:TRINITY_DN3597_c0_g1_i5.p1 TRINITY_DN3597_c0_g1~~TRINITY_DN3597_c0_g1_i5.p1  ORF type:complete len:193 (-),score=17.71 TRINITY_DN3597_c0_g1_i5:94-672(-)